MTRLIVGVFSASQAFVTRRKGLRIVTAPATSFHSGTVRAKGGQVFVTSSSNRDCRGAFRWRTEDMLV